MSEEERGEGDGLKEPPGMAVVKTLEDPGAVGTNDVDRIDVLVAKTIVGVEVEKERTAVSLA